ncbi:MAG: DNA-binding transcriptional regulator [Planctomycetota bacterium]
MTTPKVALLIETSRGYGREFLRGVARYARLHGPWGLHLTPGDFEQVLPRMRNWTGTGIIARIETPQIARAILKTGLPTVALDLSREQLRPENPLSALSEVASDSHAAARMAAGYLIERGLRSFAFVGRRNRIWSQRRRDGFLERLREDGFDAAVFRAPRGSAHASGGGRPSALAEWLAELPRPVGVMACDDDRGREVLEACRVAGRAVPDETAVIGVDDDRLLCELADPPLSSVALNAEGGGFRAAALLDDLMRGRVRKPRRLLVEPLRVVTRRSTDLLAVQDFEVARAVRVIQDRAGNGIQVGDVVAHVQISRRALETRFRAAMGRTIHDEILRIRVEKAKALLQGSELPIDRIAASAGFGTASYLSQIFRRRVGLTPGKYRARIREA